VTEVLLEKKFGGLSPASDDAYRIIGKIPTGAKISVDIRAWGRRSTEQHNFGFALLNALFEAQEYYPTLDKFRYALMIHLGHCDWYKQKNGDPIPVPHSVSFAAMPASEYSELIDEIMGYAVSIGFDRAELESGLVG